MSWGIGYKIDENVHNYNYNTRPTKLCATYKIGDEVLVTRLNSSTSKRKSTKDKWMRYVRGTVDDFSQKSSCYKISYVIERNCKQEWIKVCDTTSLTGSRKSSVVQS